MSDVQSVLIKSVTPNTSELRTLLSRLKENFNVSDAMLQEIERVNDTYPVKVSSYYYSLIRDINDPIWKMAIPDIREIDDNDGDEDPLCEERDSPAPLITHRYPDQLLLLVSDTCDMFCRFCTRKRKVGTDRLEITYAKLDAAVEYIRQHTEVRDVILSGGDAFCAPINRLEYVLGKLCAIDHVEILRLGTRVPAVNPKRVTEDFVQRISKYLELKPIFINVHFEHPNELTPEAQSACIRLANAGFPLGNQNVLLNGINNDVQTMGVLWKGLLQCRVKPYYLFQADYVKDTHHFRTSVQTGLDVIKGCRGWISGLAIPHYVIDAPEGGGKIPILPDEYTQAITDDKIILKNYQGKLCEYPQP